MSRSIISVLQALEQSDARLIRQELAASGLSPDGPQECRFLLYAILRGLDDSAVVLLESGADPALRESEKGLTPLMAAAANQRQKMVEKLLALSDPLQADADRGWSALSHAASNRGDQGAACLRLLLPKSDLAQVDAHGLNALHVAARAGNLSAVEALVDKIDPSLTDPRGETALHWAARAVLAPRSDSATRQILDVLKKAMLRTAIDAQGQKGRTAAMMLAQGNEPFLTQLLGQGSDLSLQAEDGQNLLAMLAKNAPRNPSRMGAADTPHELQKRWHVVERLAMEATDEQIEPLAALRLHEKHVPRLRARLEAIELRREVDFAKGVQPEEAATGADAPARAGSRRL